MQGKPFLNKKTDIKMPTEDILSSDRTHYKHKFKTTQFNTINTFLIMKQAFCE